MAPDALTANRHCWAHQTEQGTVVVVVVVDDVEDDDVVVVDVAGISQQH